MAKQKKVHTKQAKAPVKQKKSLTSRKNSRQSTGPRSTRGKDISKRNAISHGVHSTAPVVSGEKAEDWEAHQTGMIAAIAPVGTLERELAERVATLTWRLRRVIRYEAAVTLPEQPQEEPVPLTSAPSRCIPHARSDAIIRKELEAATENIQDVSAMCAGYRRLQTASDAELFNGQEAFDLLFNATGYTPHGDEYAFDVSDPEFLTDIGLPHDWLDRPQSYSGWTAGMVMKGVHAIAAEDGMSAEALLDQAIRDSERAMEEYTADVKRLDVELAALPPEAVVVAHVPVTAIVQRIAFPNQNALDKVMRYESHLSKQLFQTLHMLERLQAIRSGHPPAAPGALDANINAGG